MIFVTALFLASMLPLLTNSSEAQVLFRIVGGTTAPPGRYPYYTLLEITRDTPRGRILIQCGGTLARHRDIVLTAAHCLDGRDEFAGTIVGIRAIIDPSQRRIVRDVSEHVLNPGYVPTDGQTPIENDLALIRLSEPVDAIKPVHLNWDTSVPIDGQSVRIMGYGTFALGGAETSETLQVATLQIVNHDQCRAVGRRPYNLIKKDIHLCAAASGRDTCRGDSGGPLIIPSTNENDPSGDIQVGITSFGIGCADPRFPGVYTRISTFENYIPLLSCLLSRTGECFNGATRETGRMISSRSGRRIMMMGGSMGMTRVSMGMKVSMGSMMMGMAQVSRGMKGMMGRRRKIGMMGMGLMKKMRSMQMKGMMGRPRKSGMMRIRLMKAMGSMRMKGMMGRPRKIGMMGMGLMKKMRSMRMKGMMGRPQPAR